MLLSALTGLFLVRVVAQPAALVIDHPLLPRFESWQSGLVPYSWLVAFQVVILAAMCVTAWRASTGQLMPSSRLGRTLLVVGGVYFGGTVLRLVLGLTIQIGSPFFARPVPIFFHLVLASFLLVCGYYHTRAGLAGDPAGKAR